MKHFTILLLALGLSSTALAQPVEYQKGDHQLEITLNPLFDYVGRLFTENGSSLALNSGTVVYRKFLNEKKARRISLSVFADQFETDTRTSSRYSKNNRQQLSFGFGYGNEWHYPKQKWNFYYGWQMNVGLGYDRNVLLNEYYDEFEVDFQGYAKIEEERTSGLLISAGPEALGGLQYHFNEILFVGIELRAYLDLQYNTPSKSTEKTYSAVNADFPNDTVENETDGEFSATLSTTNLVLFKLGAKF